MILLDRCADAIFIHCIKAQVAEHPTASQCSVPLTEQAWILLWMPILITRVKRSWRGRSVRSIIRGILPGQRPGKRVLGLLPDEPMVLS